MDGTYGEARVGRSLLRAIDVSPDGLVIMADHGEVFVVHDSIAPITDFAAWVRCFEGRAGA